MALSATESKVAAFVSRWAPSGGAERANYQLFLTELCDALNVPRPDPTQSDHDANAYVFDRALDFIYPDGTKTANYIDLYKRGCFVLETKQGVAQRTEDALSTARRDSQRKSKKGHGIRGSAVWDTAMIAAKGQAEGYVHALPASEGRPPFVLVVDVGYSIELYSEFTRTGGTYVPFPDPRTHRILLKDLLDPEKRDPLLERLRQVWTDPMALDPSRKTARVTREIADRLAKLARALEQAGRDPGSTAEFLMRCLFTMFAEDVGLLPHNAFTKLLEQLRDKPKNFKPALEELWRVMNTGGFHSGFMEKLLKFNGGLFAKPSALELSRDHIELLIEASKADWRAVEPAIFGTLLERALDPHERHKLGAHYTPRAYVERLVIPTIVDPLRQEWRAAQAAALTLANAGKKSDAVKEVRAFHRRLCTVKVLDPACGTGNFLYVTLEHLKRLEGEVFNTLAELGVEEEFAGEGFTVDPHQLLGIEINPRAAAIAELVLWIGYLQWHYRTHGDVAPPEPIIKNFKNIENRDAVLDYDTKRTKVDPDTLKPITHWDGRTTKPHPVTGEEVPDESAQVPEYEYVNPRPAEWPEADFVVGNPPFIGVRRVVLTLGPSYVDALREAYPEVPETVDYVLYWWHKAATLVGAGDVLKFGLITTNSITQDYSSKFMKMHLEADAPVRLVLAIPDHPWIASEDGAAVRIAMTSGVSSDRFIPPAFLGDVNELGDVTFKSVSRISFRLSDGRGENPALESNKDMCFQGVVPAGAGFRLSTLEAQQFPEYERILAIKPYMIGKDITDRPRSCFIIDLFGREEEFVRSETPSLYQWLRDHVYPERKHNRRKSYADRWWIFAEPRPAMRRALSNLRRYITTPNTAKFRQFVFTPADTIPDAMAYAIASDDAFILGVLSSEPHCVFARKEGGTLEDRPRYNSKRVFFPFPFPDPPESLKTRIRELGEALDAHRKRQQALHPDLTMTGMYNVLEKLRSGETLTKKEQTIHEQGLVSVLKEIHDQLDQAVFEAYNWPQTLTDEQILENLVALNAQRAAEEARGQIRWLRPEYQAKQQPGAQLESEDLGTEKPAPTTKKPEKQPWPKTLAEQAQALRTALSGAGPLTAKDLAANFKGAKKERISELLETLAALGQCREVEDDRYVA